MKLAIAARRLGVVLGTAALLSHTGHLTSTPRPTAPGRGSSPGYRRGFTDLLNDRGFERCPKRGFDLTG